MQSLIELAGPIEAHLDDLTETGCQETAVSAKQLPVDFQPPGGRFLLGAEAARVPDP